MIEQIGSGAHLTLLVGATMLGAILTALARVLAPRWGMVDLPGGRKKHQGAMPLMGGLAVFTTLVGVTSLAFSCGWLNVSPGEPAGAFAFWLLVSGALFCMLGLADDKWVLRARDKFLMQILATLPFACYVGAVDSVHLLGVDVQVGSAGVLLSVFWLVACANVVNLLDGADGLAGTVAVVATMAAYLLARLAGDGTVALLAAVLTGSTIGFLVHNRPPARIYLGDAGSLTLGFLVGALVLRVSTTETTGFRLAVAAVIMVIPAFDTAMAILRRKLSGRGIGDPDRGHIHHVLLERGFTVLQTVLVIGGLSVATAGAAVSAAYANSDLVAFVLGAGVLAAMVIGRLFGHRELELVWARVEGATLTTWTDSANSQGAFPRAEFPAIDDLWEQLCQTARTLGASELAVVQGSHEDSESQVWRKDVQHAGPPTWKLTLLLEPGNQHSSRLEISGDASPVPIVSAHQMSDLMRMAATISSEQPPRVLSVGTPSVQPTRTAQPERKAA